MPRIVQAPGRFFDRPTGKHRLGLVGRNQPRQMDLDRRLRWHLHRKGAG
jgi:hypothetical protein